MINYDLRFLSNVSNALCRDSDRLYTNCADLARVIEGLLYEYEFPLKMKRYNLFIQKLINEDFSRFLMSKSEEKNKFHGYKFRPQLT